MTRLVSSLLIAGALLLAGCGQHAHLHPLVGEDERILASISAAPTALHSDAPTLAARALLKALETQDHAAAWRHLSRSSQSELRACFASESALAPAILAQVEQRLAAASGKTLTELCFGIHPNGFSLHPPGAVQKPPPTQAPTGIVVVHAISDGEGEHPIPMTLEGRHWRRTIPAPCPTESDSAP